MRIQRPAGFTLVELLVALFITAILFAMGYGSLTQALSNRKEVEEQTARLTALQQAFRVMEQDIELMQPRPQRDPLGNGYDNPLVASQNMFGSSANSSDAAASSPAASSAAASSAATSSVALGGLPLLSFTRGGWANPAGLPRSELQRVSYLVRDDKLIRQHQPVLDSTAATAAEERELLDQVEALSFRYMDESLAWSTTWPTPVMQRLPATALMRARPVAIEITLKLKDYGVLTRIIEIAG
jgi:general secretion pathway protein J